MNLRMQMYAQYSQRRPYYCLDMFSKFWRQSLFLAYLTSYVYKVNDLIKEDVD